MALVTYGGPRPEIQIHIEYPLGYRWRLRNGLARPDDFGKKKIVSVDLVANRSVRVEPIVAYCLGMLYRNGESRMFETVLETGDREEIVGLLRDATGTDAGAEVALDFLGWLDLGMLERLLEQESKPIFNEAGLVWAPANWRPSDV